MTTQRGNGPATGADPEEPAMAFTIVRPSDRQLEPVREGAPVLLQVVADGLDGEPYVHISQVPAGHHIDAHSHSETEVTIRGRKWVVADAEGHRVVVEGDGVVGKFPHLQPGQQFTYNSYHTIGSDSVAEGAFFGVTDSGEMVFTRIPQFEMRAPVTSA